MGSTDLSNGGFDDVAAADERFALLFEDLEAQEAGRELHARTGEYSDLVAGEAADHGLSARIAGAVGLDISVVCAGVRFVGRLKRAAETWFVLAAEGGGDVLIAAAHVDELRLPTRSHGAPAVSLSIASPLRQWREGRVACAVAVVGSAGDVRRLVGELALVSSDYLEVSSDAAGDPRVARVLVPLGRVAFVSPERGAL